MKWFMGSDHAGLPLKLELGAMLESLGDEVVDMGTNTSESVDYPDYAEKVAIHVVAEEVLGLLVCGTGNGIMMSANKVAGVRAALASNAYVAQMAKLHNNANILVFGSRVTGAGVAIEALKVFRATKFEGGRHQKRVSKMMALEGQ